MVQGYANLGTHLGKAVAFLLHGSPRLPEALYQKLESRISPIDFKGTAFAFPPGSYYEAEFGPGLFRHVVSFRGLFDPVELPSLKHLMYTIEREEALQGKRTVNIDIGYLDADKLVLASFKRGKYKLYLGNSVYGDMLLEYAKGNFTGLPWAFPDLKDGIYNRDLLSIREKFKSQLKSQVHRES